MLTIAENTLIENKTPRLIDATTFLSATTENSIKGWVGTSSDGQELTFSSVSEKGYKYAFITKSGEKWYFSETPWFYDQFPDGIPEEMIELSIWKEGSEKTIHKQFNEGEVFKSNTIDFERLKELINEAEQIRGNEVQDPARIRGYRLSSAPTGYIALVDGNKDDPIMSGMINDCRYFPQMLNLIKDHEGNNMYNLLSNNGSEFIKVSGDPEWILRQHIKALYDAGIRDFYLNFAGHGNETAIFFSTPEVDASLSPEELHAIFSDYSDCNFIVNTIACYGGGLADKMKSYKDPSNREGRILMILQAKPFTYNLEGRLIGEPEVKGSPKIFSSAYQIFNTKFLMDGLNFGEAHYQADLEAKKISPTDAEAWISTENGGRELAKNVNVLRMSSY